jgi:uncharacterized protein (DUF2235 family)
MKRIIICMDGTWQTLNQEKLTNIGIIARSIAHKETRPDGTHIHQNVIYSHGVGSSVSALEKTGWSARFIRGTTRLFGGAFGEGLEDLIVDTYLRLAFDYEEGDQIYIFGFSRGAFAARRLAGFINIAGIVSRRHTERARDGFRLYFRQPRDDAPEAEKLAHAEQARQFRLKYGKGTRDENGERVQLDTPPPIAYVGVFDTVAQRGAADVVRSYITSRDKDRYRIKNRRVASNVQSARHAVAIDECRAGFPVTLWDGLEENNALANRPAFLQRWFVGYHGDIGGGGREQLAAWALKWVTDGAAAEGLYFYSTRGSDASPLSEAIEKAAFDARPDRPTFVRSLSLINWPIRPRQVWPKERARRRERPSASDVQALFDEAVLMRAMKRELRYRPGALRPFRKALSEIAGAREAQATPLPPVSENG